MGAHGLGEEKLYNPGWTERVFSVNYVFRNRGCKIKGQVVMKVEIECLQLQSNGCLFSENPVCFFYEWKLFYSNFNYKIPKF